MPHESWEQAMLLDLALAFPWQARLVNLLHPFFNLKTGEIMLKIQLFFHRNLFFFY